MAKIMIHNPHLAGDQFYWPGGPVGILLIHGFSATAAEVRRLAEALHKVGYTIAAPLLPGHFTRPEDLNSVRWQDWVAEDEGMYKRLLTECEQVVVGGESTGGVLSPFACLMFIGHVGIAFLDVSADAWAIEITHENERGKVSGASLLDNL